MVVTSDQRRSAELASYLAIRYPYSSSGESRLHAWDPHKTARISSLEEADITALNLGIICATADRLPNGNCANALRTAAANYETVVRSQLEIAAAHKMHSIFLACDDNGIEPWAIEQLRLAEIVLTWSQGYDRLGGQLGYCDWVDAWYESEGSIPLLTLHRNLFTATKPGMTVSV
jgi:hypothetical protein